MLWRHPVATGRHCNLAIFFIVGFIQGISCTFKLGCRESVFFGFYPRSVFSVLHHETLALAPPSGDRTSGLQFFIVVFIQDEVFFFSLIIFTFYF